MTKKSSSRASSVPDVTQAHAAAALQHIAKLGLKPLPQHYELFFRYHQGDPEIIAAIDGHKGTLDDITCHRLYKRFLSESARTDITKEISDKVQTAITDMVLMLKSVQNSATEYGDTLDGVTDKLRDVRSMDDLHEIVSVIVSDTKQMLAKNQELEIQLVNSSNQVSELRQNLDQVRREATVDGLTGLANRRAFDKYIRDCIDEAASNRLPLVLMILDIDHFKKFNDSFGHIVGDQVLRLVARSLTDGIKGRDIAARYGGEEFVILLPDTHLHSGLKVAETLRKSVENKEVVNRSNQESMGQITLSIGLAEFAQDESVVDFIARADKALYEAKRTGRNRVCIAPAPPRS